MVSARQDHDGARVDEPGDSVGEYFHGVGSGQCPVVDVTGDEHCIDAFGADHIDQMVQIAGLGLQQPYPVEGSSQMPVRGMYEAHKRRL